MEITLAKVDSFLVREDIEGFIEAGAPMDEYADEAAQIVAALEAMEPSSINEDSILATVSYIWMKSFELSKDDMELRLRALRGVSQDILLLHNG